MLSEKEALKDTESEEAHQEEQHPVEILKTDKDHSSSPLHEDLSEEPEEENKGDRD
jgi:hypothetical protein